jgi:hypothetical protein
MLPDIRNRTALFEGSHAIPTCPSLKSTAMMEVEYETLVKSYRQGKTEILGGKKYRSANSSITNLTRIGPRTAHKPLKVTDLYTDTEYVLRDWNEFLPIIDMTLTFEGFNS